MRSGGPGWCATSRGDSIVLGVDANWAYDLDDAIVVGRALADLGYDFFEEPMPPEDRQGYRRLSRAVPIRLAAGESDFTAGDALESLADRSIGLIQPDVARAGGISETWRIAELAALHRVRYAPHVGWSGALCVAASLQLAAAAESFWSFECMVCENPLRQDSDDRARSARRACCVDGELPVPDGPGLGVEIDRDRAGSAAGRRREMTASAGGSRRPASAPRRCWARAARRCCSRRPGCWCSRCSCCRRATCSGCRCTSRASGSRPVFVGVDNYVAVLSDRYFWRALVNTLIIVAVVVHVEMLLGLGIALLFADGVPWKPVLMAVMLAPYAVSEVGAVVIWRYLVDPEIGSLTQAARGLRPRADRMGRQPVARARRRVADLDLAAPAVHLRDPLRRAPRAAGRGLRGGAGGRREPLAAAAPDHAAAAQAGHRWSPCCSATSSRSGCSRKCG